MKDAIRTEIVRLQKAFFYSLDGFKQAMADRGAFRTEVLLTPVIALSAFYLGRTAQETAILLGVWLLVLLAELLNTGIEAVTDLACQGNIHPLAKKAKDTGSAAVLLAAVICVIVWAGRLL